MRISQLLAEPVLVLGAGREGLAVLDLLVRRGHRGTLQVVADRLPPQLPPGVQAIAAHQLGEALSRRPVVVRSPGFAPGHPWRQQVVEHALREVTGTQLMLAELRAAGLAVVGVTASKGKSTTSSLLAAMLEAGGLPARLLGNIGAPALASLDDVVARRPVVVLELSSYQCDDLEPGEGPDVAVLGPLFPEHLDWHGSLAAYYQAKLRLPASVPPGGHVIAHGSTHATLAALGLPSPATFVPAVPASLEWVQRLPDGSLAPLYADAAGLHDGPALLASAGMWQVPGQHNRENAALAWAAARYLGARPDGLHSALAGFAGLPFRLQDEGVHGGAHWTNDSISTAPEAACAALEAFRGDVHTLIAGGQDRGYDYTPLAQAILHWQVRTLVLLPESGQAIAAALAALPGSSTPPAIVTCATLGEAVTQAAARTPAGRRCLFSPAAPSYHAWSGFEARGAEFQSHLHRLP